MKDKLSPGQALLVWTGVSLLFWAAIIWFARIIVEF
tara:strand:- start:5098 stop:5205 length:108 start_codon:yes stop_codon:yes gene_type:complete